MTRLDARMVDLSIQRDEDGNIRSWSFRFGKCEDFQETLDEFKQAIPPGERKPEPENKWLWTVTASTKNYNALQRLFDNFVEAEEKAKSQLRLI